MIIFDLDGTLADCEHRRRFVDPSKNPDYYFWKPDSIPEFPGGYYHKTEVDSECSEMKKRFRPDWKAFYEACDKDEPIEPTCDILRRFIISKIEVQIWSGRCESVREKTTQWLTDKVFLGNHLAIPKLKMRPIGDNTPDDQLKERWLNDRCSDLTKMWIEGENPVIHEIQYVFDSDPASIAMWRRRGIFVFNCAQDDREF